MSVAKVEVQKESLVGSCAAVREAVKLKRVGSLSLLSLVLTIHPKLRRPLVKHTRFESKEIFSGRYKDVAARAMYGTKAMTSFQADIIDFVKVRSKRVVRRCFCFRLCCGQTGMDVSMLL